MHFPDDQAAQLVFIDVGQLGCQGISAVIGNEIEVIVGFGIVVPQIRRFLFLIIALMPSGSSLFNSGLLNGDQVMPGEIVDRVRGGADNFFSRFTDLPAMAVQRGTDGNLLSRHALLQQVFHSSIRGNFTEQCRMMTGVFFPGARHVVGHQVDLVHIGMQGSVILLAQGPAHRGTGANGQELRTMSEMLVQRFAQFFQQQGVVGPVVAHHRATFIAFILRFTFHTGILPVDVQAAQERIGIQRVQAAPDEGAAAFRCQRHFGKMTGIRPSADGDQDLCVGILFRAFRILREMSVGVVRICVRPGISGYNGKAAVLGNHFPESVVNAVQPVPRQALDVAPGVGIDIPVREINRHAGFLLCLLSRSCCQEQSESQGNRQ